MSGTNPTSNQGGGPINPSNPSDVNNVQNIINTANYNPNDLLEPSNTSLNPLYPTTLPTPKQSPIGLNSAELNRLKTTLKNTGVNPWMTPNVMAALFVNILRMTLTLKNTQLIDILVSIKALEAQMASAQSQATLTIDSARQQAFATIMQAISSLVQAATGMLVAGATGYGLARSGAATDTHISELGTKAQTSGGSLIKSMDLKEGQTITLKYGEPPITLTGADIRNPQDSANIQQISQHITSSGQPILINEGVGGRTASKRILDEQKSTATTFNKQVNDYTDAKTTFAKYGQQKQFIDSQKIMVMATVINACLPAVAQGITGFLSAQAQMQQGIYTADAGLEGQVASMFSNLQQAAWQDIAKQGDILTSFFEALISTSTALSQIMA